MALASGCAPLPEVQYETDRLQIAPSFDDPICEGTLLTLDEHLGEVERGLGQVGIQDPFRLYWVRDDIVEYCGDQNNGCFFPSTRLMFARGRSITHEMTHAVLDSEGHSYFLEEGMAELWSGVGVYYDLSDEQADLGPRLRLSPSQYRDGRLDYNAAAHFVRHIYDRRGTQGIGRLAAEVARGAAPERLEHALEQLMGLAVDEIEADYRAHSRPAYEGLSYDRVPAMVIEEIDQDDDRYGPERLRLWVHAELDCEMEDTMGPLPDERRGMYQVRRVVIPENEGARLWVEGDPGTWVEVINPYARARRGEMLDWMFPDARLDPGALRLEPGDVLQTPLRPGTRAIVLGADEAAAGRVTLHIELDAPPPPADPSRSI